MDRLNVDQAKATFGPEWLSFSKEVHSSHFSSEDDQSGRYNSTTLKNGSRTYYSSVKKVPLRFTRSKSTPLLPNVEEGEGEEAPKQEKKTEDVFTMLKERNSFDRNFPTLNTVKPRNTIAGFQTNNGNANPIPPTTAHNNPIILSNKIESSVPNPNTGTAWKSSQSKPIPLNGSVTPSNGTATSPGSRDGSETTEIQLASCIVPNVQPPKVLTKNRVELLIKKGPNKKKFDTSLLRKATSEPNLPIPAAYQEQYAKLMAAARKVPDPHKDKYNPKPAEKPKSGPVVLNRSDFFKGLVKKEQTNGIQKEGTFPKVQHRRVYSDDQSGLIALQTRTSPPPLVTPGEDPHPSSYNEERSINPIIGFDDEGKDLYVSNKESLETNTHNSSNGSSRSTSPKLLSLEDEERFLRDLGWVPEEEDHVPELTEEEILEESNKLKNWMMTQITNKKKRNSQERHFVKFDS